MTTLEMDFFEKWQNTSACSSNQKQTNTGWNSNKWKCGQDRCKDTMDIKGQAVKNNRTPTQICKNTHTYLIQHYHTHATKKVNSRQNPHPNQRQRGRAAQDKTPRADCLLWSYATNPINPAPPKGLDTWDAPSPDWEPSSFSGLTWVPALMPSGLQRRTYRC